MISKIIACIDNSKNSQNIISLASFFAKNNNSKISLLHVAQSHSENLAQINLSGSIGLGAQSAILEEISEDDEIHGKTEQRKGFAIISKAKRGLSENKIINPKILHLRGPFVDILLEEEEEADLIILGKNGEKSEKNEKGPVNVGENLAEILKNGQKNLIISGSNYEDIQKLALNFNENSEDLKIIKNLIEERHLQKVEFHLIVNKEIKGRFLKQAEEILNKSKVRFVISKQDEENSEDFIINYIKQNNINLFINKYKNESKIIDFILGNKSLNFIKKITIPIFLIRT